jgi:hypothetical protein
MKLAHITSDYGIEGWVRVPRWRAAAREAGMLGLVFFAVVGFCWTVTILLLP